MVEPDRGERVLRSGTTVRYMAQEPDVAGFETTLAYAKPG
jgi:ATP-binding cassette subfamily F protein uup